METELALLSQIPILGITFFVWRALQKSNREQQEYYDKKELQRREYQDRKDKEWQLFLDDQSNKCRQWCDNTSSVNREAQYKMAGVIDKLADKVANVETKVDFLLQERHGTGPLDGKRIGL